MAIKKYTNGSWTPACRKYGTETDTITTFPASIIGDGTPITSYTIKGNMEQSGTPTPSNPIYPSECGERTENLYSSTLEQGATAGGVLIPAYNRVRSGLIYLGTGQFTFSCFNNDDYQIAVDYHLSDGTYSSGTSWLTTKTFELTSQTPIIRLKIRYPDDSSILPTDVSNIMLTEGSTAPTSYIPYGYKLPLTLGSTTTDIYLGEVQSTRRVRKLVLTGEEIWNKYPPVNYSFYNTLIPSKSSPVSACTHFEDVHAYSELVNKDYAIWCATTYTIIKCYPYTTIEDFTQFLRDQYDAGTPVTVWYVLAEPETGIGNEPIRKIGDYVDSVSGTGLATSGTAQGFDVGTALKPSEADLTYHGWHEHDDTKYST